MKTNTISDTGIVPANFNGHWKQELIFSNDSGEKFKIAINHTAPVSTLYKWSDKEGWLFVLQKSTTRDYGIDTAYAPKDRIKQNAYAAIIEDLKKISTNF